ncbi:fimbrillin family protein [Elizabethkingia ursingii]|uniref:fimbrillin family protein n=1 Tax=Elizabethkingia ursingii TaxID=1756150 RepID=UPI00201239A3|nr:fimbrillin family protein [Elizabethkingia ursingii]MCL1673749.1 fimbrillin family protein [Elizabethkingia ursingii]
MMKIQLSIKNTFYKTSVFLLVFYGLTACRSSDNVADGNNNGQTVVKVNMLGTSAESTEPEKTASVTKTGLQNEAIQRQVIAIDKKQTIIATLTPESSSANSAQASVNPLSGIIKQEKLKAGSQYVVIVYDDKGAYLDEKTFTYGQQEAGFLLTGDKTYTFVAYSVDYTAPARTTKDLPLSQAKLENISKDLMFFKRTMMVTGNKENNLDVVLKHRYSQITTKIDASAAGNITDISSAIITPVRTSASISFDRPDALSYGPISANGTTVEFSNKNQSIITSTPTLLISDATTSGELNIKSITVGGTTRNDIKINNLKITPGVRYGLDLKFDAALKTIKVLGITPDQWASGIATGSRTSLAREKLNDKLNFGPNGKVRIENFQIDDIDVRNFTPQQLADEIDKYDIIWVGYVLNSQLTADKRAVLEQKVLEKKKFFFIGNDNYTTAYFPGRNTPFAGFTFDTNGAGTRQINVIPAGPTQGIFGNLTQNNTIKQIRAIGKVTDYPANATAFLTNPDGSINAVASDNLVSVGDINWYLSYESGDGLTGGTSSCTENSESILFCNIFEKAINYIKNQP